MKKSIRLYVEGTVQTSGSNEIICDQSAFLWITGDQVIEHEQALRFFCLCQLLQLGQIIQAVNCDYILSLKEQLVQRLLQVSTDDVNLIKTAAFVDKITSEVCLTCT